MKKYIYILTLILTVFITSCENDDIETSDLNYVTFSEETFSAGVDPGSTASVEITVFTTNKVGSDRSFGLTVDASSAAAGSYTVPESVTIPSGSNRGTFTVALSDTNLGIGINTLIINIAAEEGLYNIQGTTIEYVQNCTELAGTLDLVFDFYATETTWEILNSEGGLVTEGGPYNYDNDPVSIPITLCQGRDYTLIIYDSYGDGFCCTYGDGSYALTVNGNEISSGDGAIGEELSIDFSL